MAKDVLVRIKGSDDLSPVFKKVGASAKGAAADIKGLEKDLQASGQAAQQAGAGYAQFSDDVKQVGQAVGVAAGALALSGQSFRDQQISLNNLSRTYGEAADDIRAFALQLEDTSNFSDEAITSAANLAGTLARNYGFTQQEIQQVLQISADLAAATGYSMEDATYRVTAALRGEAEAAEALGLTMNQQAIDHNNVTLAMSNEEAGHYRLNALIQQSAFAMGAAAEQADTTYGSMTDLGQSIRDAAQSVGEFLGPIGEIGAYAADNAIQIGIMAIALKQLGEGAVALNSLSKAMTGVGLASNALSLAMGPVGVAAAAGAAVVGLGLLVNYLKDEYHSATAEASVATDAFTQTVIELGKAGTLSYLEQQIAQLGLGFGIYATNLNEAQDEQHALKDQIVETIASMGDAGGYAVGSEGLKDYTEAQQEALDANHDMFVSLEEMDAAQRAIGDTMAITGETIKDYTDNWAAAQDDINAIMMDTGPAAADAQAELLKYMNLVHDGVYTMEGLKHKAAEINDELQAQNAASAATGDSLGGLATQVDKVAGSYKTLDDYLKSYRQNQGIGGQNLAGEHREAAEAIEAENRALAERQALVDEARSHPLEPATDYVASIYDANVALNAEALATAESAIAHDRANAQLEIAADAYSRMSVEAARAATAQIAAGKQLAAFAERPMSVEAAMAGAQMAPMTLKVFLDDQAAAERAKDIAAATEQMATQFNAATTAVTGTSQALESGFRVAVENTSALGKQAQSVQDWADELIGAQGVQATMDDLLARGVITQQDYNAAQAAYTPIAEANARIQDDILEIQTKQAPVMADLMEQQADYLDSLADAPAQQQAFALAMMDSATSAQALQLATSLLGENGDVFAPMVEAAANLDPYLATILEQMGLIEQMPDGTWKVTAETTDAQSDLDRLSSVVEKLAYTEILIHVGFDRDQADQEFYETFGYHFGENPEDAEPVDQVVPVRLHPEYLIDPDAGNADPRAMTAAAAQAAFSGMTEPIPVTVPVALNWDFSGGLGPAGTGSGAGSAFGGMPDLPDVSISVTADSTSAIQSIGEAQAAAETYGSTSADALIGADNSGAISSIGEAESSRDAWGSSSATAQINAADNASGVIASVSGALAALDGQTATTYINTVYTTTGTPSIGAASGRVIPHLANGGYPVITAEVGPELARLSGGGFALMSGPGMRVLQPGDLVFNSPASKSMMDGHSLGGFSFYNYGTIIGVDDLEAKIARSISSGIVKAQDQRSRGWAF